MQFAPHWLNIYRIETHGGTRSALYPSDNPPYPITQTLRTMPLLSRTLLIAAAFCLVTAPAWAGKVPYQPEELESESKLIVSGKVESFEKKVTANQDGSKTATITLKIAVDKVHKGDAKAGDVIEATAWRVVKMPRPGIILWDSGNDFIPAVGVKAKFFFGREYEQRLADHVA